MNEEITASYPIDVAVFKPAFRWHLHRLTRWKWLVLLVIASGVSTITLVSSHAVPKAISMAVLTALVGIVSYAVMMLVYRSVLTMQIKRIPAYGMGLDYSINESGMRSTTGEAESFLPWNLVFRTLITPEGVLVYPQRNMFNWLPKTGFASDSDYRRFLELAASKTKHSKIG